MPPKTSSKQANEPQASGKEQEQQVNEPSQAERKQESSKAAKKALELEKEAKRLTQAAAGAGDPEERQKLLNEALKKQLAAEKFGKVAKWLQSGTIQGAIAGGGIGMFPGATLGTLTGTLVGGLTSAVLGGLGAAGGAAYGAINGPLFDIAERAGAGIQKITGNLPGWKATPEQKKALERMMG
ncbi:hypothetical protein EJ03DRAFT_360011 [Teratosphaeria nubilosa]|uniref:Uncharacterized protein n=1 Tax=Teratosphaeria nubilosa TaxID=161662 RepID=A0A6G1KUJ5_9PEZI|nr:hypothetical protein EJ03DRAFT_360011 [Teratosphaeria nubilosa]